MLRKLMLSLFAAAALAGCNTAPLENCTDYGTWDGNGDAVVASTSCPEPANEEDVVIPDGGAN